MSKKTTFIDLFAGIGGFHLAMHKLGAKCVFASEIDNHARKTYETNFSKIEPELFENKCFNSDIRNINYSEIPDFDILCAGFPCQPFSQAGLKRGFEDLHNSERGNLFFYIAEILQEKKPKAFFLENVQGLLKHDNGKTFQVIRHILEEELGYSFYYKVVKASDYGLPQHRPRLFMVGFRDEEVMKGFHFPPSKPLNYTLNDIFQGNCDREIGYTLRVGGRGSGIDDRRNWEFYRVDGQVKRISVKEGKKLQGFPDDFEFPVSETQAMKQLGNSVAVDAVYEVAKNLIDYLSILDKNKTEMKQTKNKGEWSELLVFLKCIYQQKINFGNADMEATPIHLDIKKVFNQNDTKEFIISNQSKVIIRDKENSSEKEVDLQTFLDENILSIIQNKIVNGKNTFDIDEFKVVQNQLGIDIVKGGNSNQKSDIRLGFDHNGIYYDNQGFGIKSYLGSKPTLLNASSNTNFIFKISNLSKSAIDIVNGIDSKQKIKDRIQKIRELGGEFTYVGAEKDTMEFNLKMIDSQMPQLIGKALMSFYFDRVNSVEKVVDAISKTEEELKLNQNKFKNLLIAILLGFFAGEKWNGEFEANGTIVLKSTGELLAYHIVKLSEMKEYLFKHIKFDTPSSSRHMFGSLYQEKNGEIYFKLNMQLRF
ncbi:MAG: HpaII family restriction endonuclease [Bacteroidota bacterium]|nr:HpaII family restriction endonuclease [Bacteroidota bacterium]